MNIRIAILATMLVLPTAAAWAQEEDPGIVIQAWSASDPDLQIPAEGLCADFLADLIGPHEKYELLGIAGVAGPPGAVYTLVNNRGEMVILKCGTTGGHAGGGGGCEG